MQGLKVDNKKIAKNTLFLYGRMIIVLFVSLYTTRVVLHALGVVDYGINNVVAGFVSMFSFLNTSMANGIQRFYNFENGSKNGKSLEDVYNTALLIQFLLALVIVIVLESFGLWYINNKMVIPLERLNAAVWVFHCSVVSLALVIIQIPYSAAIMSHEKMDYYAIVSLADVFLKLILAFVISYVSYDKLIFYGVFTTLISLVNFSCYFIYCKCKFQEIKFERAFHKDIFKQMLSFSGWNIFDSFSYMLKGQGLNILLNAFFGPIVNAARAVSNQIMSAVQGFSANIVTAFRPQLVESYAQTNYKRVCKLMYSVSKLSYIFLYVICVPLVLEIRYILDLWLAGEVPDFTVEFTILVLANMLFSSLNMPLSQVVQATGKLKKYNFYRSLLVVSTLPIAWIFLKLGYNAVSVFWISLLISILNQPLSLWLLHRIFPYSINDYMKEVVFPCLVLSIVLPIFPYIIYCIMPTGFIRLIVICFVTVVISVALLYLFLLNDKEKEITLSFCHKFFKK